MRDEELFRLASRGITPQQQEVKMRNLTALAKSGYPIFGPEIYELEHIGKGQYTVGYVSHDRYAYRAKGADAL